MCFLFTCGFLHVCGRGSVFVFVTAHVCVCVCVCVSVCPLPSDLWGLSSSASSLSLLAWRMNGPLSALPQPLLLALSLSNYLSSSLSPTSLYLISPHALPLHAPCHPHFLLPGTILSLCSLSWFDPYFPCSVTPPLRYCTDLLVSSVALGCALTRSWPLIWFQVHFIWMRSIPFGDSVSMLYLLSLPRLMFQWMDVEFALIWHSWEQMSPEYLFHIFLCFMYFYDFRHWVCFKTYTLMFPK